MIRAGPRAIDDPPKGLWHYAAAGTLIAALVMVTAVGLRFWAGPKRGAAINATYRYAFQRASRGSVLRDLQREIAFYQERITRDPQGGLDLASLAGAYLKVARATGDLSWYLLAEQAARRSLANLPFRNNGATLVLARVAEARHDFAEAIRLAEQASGHEDGLSIKVTAHLAAGRVEEAARAAEMLVARSPTLGGYTLRALVKVARGQDEDAIQDFHKALAAEEPGEAGGSAAARTYLGRLHFKRGRLTLASDLYREALRILPQYPLALVNLAELEIRLGHYEAAGRHFTQVVTISQASPNIFDHVVLRGLARVAELRGDRSGAKGLWDEAERRLRRDVTVGTFGHRRELARLLLERGRSVDAAEALSLMQTEVRVRRDAETFDILAWALSRSGRWREAQQAMREALRWGIRDAGMLYRAGTIEEALGNQARARAIFRTALETDPTFNEQARRALGLGY